MCSPGWLFRSSNHSYPTSPAKSLSEAATTHPQIPTRARAYPMWHHSTFTDMVNQAHSYRSSLFTYDGNHVIFTQTVALKSLNRLVILAMEFILTLPHISSMANSTKIATSSP